MIWILIFFFGGVTSWFVHRYLTRFAEQLSQDIHQTYCEIFPHNPPRYKPTLSILKPLKCGHYWLYFLLFAITSLMVSYFVVIDDGTNNLFISLAIAFIYFSAITLMFIITLIDWNYRLISPAACQLLLICGITLAYFQFGIISLEQSLQNASLCFLLFWGLFHLTKWHYQQDAFGRGDYWLIAALSSFLPWQSLPIFVLLASLFGLTYGIYLRIKKSMELTIPFAPFLILGALVSFMANMLG